MNSCKPVKTQYIGELPVDTLASMPDYILTERDVLDEATGNTIRSITRTPSTKLFPNITTDNIFSVMSNNVEISIPEAQVRAVRIVNAVSTNIMYYADTTHAAQFIAVGQGSEDVILGQNSGVINLPNHQYIVGQQYYTGDDGEPVTDNTSGQKLFIPISETQLLVNL